MKRVFLLLAATGWLLVLVPVAAHASNLSSFHGAMSDAYRSYREASFYLRTGNVGAGALALETAVDAWRDLRSRYEASPPDAYSDDAQWGAALAAIGRRMQNALALVDAGDVPAAGKELAPVRGMLGELRRRNGQWLHSDCIDTMNGAMDVLWRYRHDPPDLSNVETVNRIKAETAVTDYWYRRCFAEAPAGLREDPQFRRLFEGSFPLLEEIWPRLDAGDVRAFISSLRGLRSFDRLIWLSFG